MRIPDDYPEDMLDAFTAESGLDGCEETSPWGWFCCRQVNHTGDHVATKGRDPETDYLARWERS